MRTTVILLKESKAGMLLALIVGIIFTTLGLLIANGTLKGGDCEYLCTLGACIAPLHSCTSNELFFRQTGFSLWGFSACFSQELRA